ncbi:MAG TPA: dipeptidase [candidate division Zixibacteria bacterium]|nr:dipeptidase [candidate division Zixibacteria bacterium]
MIDPLELHHSAFVADLHCDTVLRIRQGRDFSVRNERGHIDLPRLQEGGVGLQVFASWIDNELPADRCRAEADSLIDLLETTFSPLSDRIVICHDQDEVLTAGAAGKIAALLSIENGTAIENNLANLEHFYERGVRLITLTHFKSSEWCESSSDSESKISGLSEFGREVVTEMNRLGMIVDISHASVKAAEHVLETTTVPIVASHSCVHEICRVDRNLTDEQIRAIADNGGMIGLNLSTGFINQEWENVAREFYEARKDEIDSVDDLFDAGIKPHDHIKPVYREFWDTTDKVQVTIEQAVDHIDHIYKLVGADHIGLGSDFDGIARSPEGLADCSQWPNLTAELVRRGYRAREIRKILGGNFLRIIGDVCG